ncbi:T9SS type B sorting domain-containing protein [Flavobacterium sp.]|uniref:T9SS type B sorting domain-containing protein n=1 Tax=Flavobacterium sp. TaxID=239 RepID=UPI0039E3CB25
MTASIIARLLLSSTNALSNAAQLEVDTIIIPDFATALSLCYGETAPVLNTTSPNGISGTWSPATIDNTANGSYQFTPNPGQCAANVTLAVTINTPITPDFTTMIALCHGETAPTLNPISPNGIAGSWSPAAIDNTATGNYTFTPNAGQCADIVVLSVTVNTRLIPNFPTTLTLCQGETAPALNPVSPNGISGTWSSPGISNTVSGAYIFTPNAGQCADPMTLNVTVTASLVPDFAPTLQICHGSTAPVLNAVSPNGISGSWSPSIINNTVSGTYVFTPNMGQCATPTTLNVTVNPQIIPDFPTTLVLCQGDAVPVLNAVSPNGISGTWSPSTISNTVSGIYVFTPNAGQCATGTTLNVTVNPPIVPDFTSVLTLCQGDAVPMLNAVSPNGISGTWSPPAISNMVSGMYVFTPSAGQCATNATLNVTVNLPVTPDFATTLVLCQGDAVPVLNLVSPNGISGTWSPSSINNTANGIYTFTPNAGQCATQAILNVTVNPLTVPDFATTLVMCQGTIAPMLNSVSPNGISGTWSPATISNTANGTYTFTPNPGQCADTTALTVTVTTGLVPDFAPNLTLCAGTTAPVLSPISPNGITGSWSPSVIDNTVSGHYAFTPDAGQCATNVILNVTVNPVISPNFATTLQLCSGTVAPVLDAISPNGISGTWNPSVINNSVSGSYVFTPNAGQCATNRTLVVTINNLVTPDFPTSMTLCSGSVAPVLNAISPNGISGTWSPSVVNNTVSGNYVFTPNAGQCANSTTLNVNVQNAIVPDFTTSLLICSGGAVPALANVSPNGIVGIWTPSVISNTVSANYTFTPNAGQCASAVTLSVTVNAATVPNFPTALRFCTGSVAPVLNAVSPNGVSGTWSPSVVSNTVSGNYVFSPTAGQCATTATLTITIDALPQPVLQDAFICVDQSGNVINPANLYCNIPNSGYTFAWTWNGNPLPTTTHTHLATQPGLYEVLVTNQTTGCTAAAQANVSMLQGFTAQAITGVDFDNDGTITVIATGGSGHFEYELDGALTQQNNQFFNVAAGEHTVTVRDLNGCADYSFDVFLLDYPRFFTPNGDGFNDFWNIGGLGDQRDSKIYVFDRYGKLIKSLKPSDTSGWDGTYNGRPLPSTDYWFELFYQNRSGEPKRFKAHFALKR